MSEQFLETILMINARESLQEFKEDRVTSIVPSHIIRQFYSAFIYSYITYTITTFSSVILRFHVAFSYIALLICAIRVLDYLVTV